MQWPPLRNKFQIDFIVILCTNILDEGVLCPEFLCTFIFIFSRKLGHYLHPASWMLCIGKEKNTKLRFPIFFSSSNFFSSSPNWEENKWWMKKIYNPVPTLSKSTTVAKITIGSQQQQQHYIKNIVFRLSMYVHETPLGIY